MTRTYATGYTNMHAPLITTRDYMALEEIEAGNAVMLRVLGNVEWSATRNFTQYVVPYSTADEAVEPASPQEEVEFTSRKLAIMERDNMTIDPATEASVERIRNLEDLGKFTLKPHKLKKGENINNMVSRVNDFRKKLGKPPLFEL